ncbi:hypothetical protein M422DRAFT_254734 [Sphaerobolus stellatus SS14]|uniref:Uncharacterized protein n=1 Tax=Sphaerobolus stellatus (strain SS14) TaxID=990650 RepID=A0A0C9V588_SPHS4|nr:hypothetical protein M422DRAFT_254734 [Sphaerobolus stellatus SS14]
MSSPLYDGEGESSPNKSFNNAKKFKQLYSASKTKDQWQMQPCPRGHALWKHLFHGGRPDDEKAAMHAQFDLIVKLVQTLEGPGAKIKLKLNLKRLLNIKQNIERFCEELWARDPSGDKDTCSSSLHLADVVEGLYEEAMLWLDGGRLSKLLINKEPRASSDGITDS